jgi:hypothetical protein
MTFGFFPYGTQSWSTDEDALPTIVTGSNEPFVVYDSNVLLDAARCNGEIPTLVGTRASDIPQYFFGPSDIYDFTKDAEYSLGLFSSVKRYGTDLSFYAKMEIYLIGSGFPTADPLGVKIGELDVTDTTNYKRFEYQYFNFFPKVTGKGRLRFVVYGGQWHISDITLQPASDFGFTPDESLSLIPVIGHQLETLTFTTEFYDLNNNLFPVKAVALPLKFDGGTIFVKGTGNRIDGALSVGPSGSGGPVLTSTGITVPSGPSGSLVFEPGMPAIYIGSGSWGQADTAFLVGSSSIGPVISVGDVLKGANNGISGSFLLEVSGTLAIDYYVPGLYTDIRTILADISGSSSLFLQQQIAYSASLLSASLIALSASLAQALFTSSVVNDVNKIQLPTSTKTQDGLYLESGSMGFYDMAHNNYSVVINADGSFRFSDRSSWTGDPNDPYRWMVGFNDGAFVVRTANLLLDTPGLQLFGGSSNNPVNNALKMGISASNMTFASGSGFYADGAGNVRFGDGIAAGEFFSFTPGVGNGQGSLIISSSNFFLQAGSGSNFVKLNAFELVLGNEANVTSFPPQPTFVGSYLNSLGQFWVGNSSQYMRWDGAQLTFTGNLSGSSGTFSGDITGATGTFSGTVASSNFISPTARFWQSIRVGFLTNGFIEFEGNSAFLTFGVCSTLTAMPYTAPLGKGLSVTGMLYTQDISAGNILSNGYQVTMVESGPVPTPADIRPAGMIRLV